MIRTRGKSPKELVAVYIAEVQAGGPGIGQYERWMVERHLLDLRDGANRGLYFDEAQAHRACLFFPLCLVHTAGEWAGEPFDLLPHQAFWIWSLEGWRWADTKRRRFRKGLIYIARKNGKTQFAAGFAIKELKGHPRNFPEPEGEIYCAATLEEEAARTWRAALRMLDASEAFDERQFYVTGRQNIKKAGVITYRGEPNLGASFLALSKRAANSLNPHLVIKDEMHNYRADHRAMCETLSTGGGAKQQPLELITTTAGDDGSELLNEELSYIEHVVARGALGDVVDDGVFGAIYRIDPEHGDNWLNDPKLWRQANPGLGVTPSLKYLQDLVMEARGNPSKRQMVARYNMNVTVSSFAQAFPPESWNRGRSCLVPSPNATAYGGVDLAKANDFCGVGIVIPRQIDGKWHYGIKSHSWCCDGPSQKLDFSRPPFAQWIKDGHLSHSTDSAIDTTPIKAWIREAAEQYTLQTVAYDQMRCTEMSTELLNYDGIPMADMPQVFMRYEPAIKEFLDALEDGRIHHEDDPCLSWQANNAEFKSDHREYRMIAKGGTNPLKKVDAITAKLMAMAAAIQELEHVATGPAVIF